MAVGPCSAASTKASLTDNGYIYQVRTFAFHSGTRVIKTRLCPRHLTSSTSAIFGHSDSFFPHYYCGWEILDFYEDAVISQMSMRTVLQRITPLEICCLATGERESKRGDDGGVWLCLGVFSNELQ